MEEKELIESPLASDKLIAIAEAAERRALAIKKIKNQALRVTNERDWVDQGGRPYIQASGARRLQDSSAYLGDSLESHSVLMKKMGISGLKFTWNLLWAMRPSK